MANSLPLQNTDKNILFTYETNYTNAKPGAPRLVPKSESGNSGTPDTNKVGIIDVVNGFTWTTLPPETRKLVPQIEMREYRITSSTLIQSAIQQARSAVDAVGGFSDNLIADIGKGIRIMGFEIEDSEIAKYLNSTYEGIREQYLEPYKFLYPVQPTKWVYNFPYFGAGNMNAQNTWGDKGDDTAQSVKEIMTLGGPGKLINALQAGARTAPLFNITQPGSYTETIKHYTPSEGPTYRVEFNLINTMKYEDIQKNWELCFLLTYQNLPNRRTISLLDPPVIYSAVIPGVHQFLYSYISNLQIQNIGSMRYVDLDIGRKLIPEAYNISFELKDLLTHTQNLFLFANEGNKVEVTVTP
jgi:hypothetical protein